MTALEGRSPDAPERRPSRDGSPVALVTGAAGAIGSVTARELTARGYTVVVTARDETRARAALDRIGAAGTDPRPPERDVAAPRADVEPGAPPRMIAVPLDVTSPDAWSAAIRRVEDEVGAIDLLVNNAGIVEPGRTDELALDSVRRQVETNLMGVIHGCRAVLPAMRARGRGRIVNVASLAGIVPMPHEAVYCATKHAVRGYSLSLREELRGSGVSVSIVSCGSVATSQLATELAAEGTWMSFVDPPLSAEEVARGIARAALRGDVELLLPRASGLFSRLLMAWPRAMLAVMPLLRRIGTRNMARLRSAGGGVSPA